MILSTGMTLCTLVSAGVYSLDSMERGTVEWNSGTMEWNSGMVERWNTGMVERAINDPVPFLLHKWTNWACALANGGGGGGGGGGKLHPASSPKGEKWGRGA